MTDKLPAKADLNSLVAIANANISVEKGGEVKFNESELSTKLFEATEIDEKTSKRVYDIVATIGNAVAQAVGEQAIEYMANNKDVDEVSAKFKFGHEKVSVLAKRKGEFRNPANGETIAKPGALTRTRILVNGGSELTGIKEHLASIATKKL